MEFRVTRTENIAFDLHPKEWFLKGGGDTPIPDTSKPHKV